MLDIYTVWVSDESNSFRVETNFTINQYHSIYIFSISVKSEWGFVEIVVRLKV